jgi:hypothetical protein
MARWSTRKPQEVVEAAAEEPSSLIASAVRIRLDGQSWRTWRFGDDSWQQEAWRLYDIIGELRFVANWVGSACSRVRLYVADVDKNGRVQQEVKDAKIAALAETILGGPSAQAEAIRMMGINLTIVGDCYILARSNGKPLDEEEAIWTVVSGTELRRWGPGGQNVAYLYGDGRLDKEILDPKRDLIIRIWTPHPRRNLWADSPTRGAMPMLWEIERLTRFVFAQIDSRLVSAGLFPIPKEVSFPDEDPTLSGADQLAERLMRTGAAGLKGEGTAAGVVPTFVEMPMEALGKLSNIQFTSELSQHAMELRSEAIRRFALAMDIDPSILGGLGEANHWGAWQIQEGQVKVHIEPLMNRICDGITAAYLKPALKLMKKDPDRYTLWYDTAPLTVRPERLKDTREMYKEGLVSRETVLLAGDYAKTDAPTDEEDLMRFTRELMLRDPNLLQIPAIRAVAGYTEEILPSNTIVTPMQPGGGMMGAGPPPPPPPPTGIEAVAGQAPPADSVAQNALPGPGGAAGVPAGTPATVTASAGDQGLNVFLVANATVLRAMERAGKRMLTRFTANNYPDTPLFELHTQLPARQDIDNLLSGAWDQMSALADAVDPRLDVATLQEALNAYCSRLLVTRQPHRPELLAGFLRQNGLLRGQP